MNYQVFARKWRPKKFLDIVGQEHIITAIIHSFSLHKIHHAYIFSGIRGTGKTTIGRLFAKGLNCERGPTSDICCQCESCKDIESGYFIDLIEIDAASKTGVEDIRELLDSVQYFPSKGRYKVYLIDEAHMLSRNSFNALLKTLEEPPEHVKFILITTERQKLPETIVSRCLQFYLKPLNITQIITQLTYIFERENIEADVRALELIAYESQGSMRDALNLSEQAILLGNNSIVFDTVKNMLGLVNMEDSLSFVENLVNSNIDSMMSQIENYSILRINWDCFFNEILSVLQKIAVNQFLSNSLQKQINSDKIEHAQKRIYDLCTKVSPENIQLYYQIFLLGRRELAYAPSHRMGMEMTVLRALAFCPMHNLKNSCKTNYEDLSSYRSFTSSTKIINNSDQYHDHTKIHNQSKLKSTYDDNTFKKTKMLKNLSHDTDNLCIQENNTANSIDCTNKIMKMQDSSDQFSTNVTSKILGARSKLVAYKEKHKKLQTKSNVDLTYQNISKKIFERFSKINTNITENEDTDKKKIKTQQKTLS